MAEQKRFDDFKEYLEKLKNDGHSKDRINSMMSRAMCGVKL